VYPDLTQPNQQVRVKNMETRVKFLFAPLHDKVIFIVRHRPDPWQREKNFSPHSDWLPERRKKSITEKKGIDECTRRMYFLCPLHREIFLSSRRKQDFILTKFTTTLNLCFWNSGAILNSWI